MTLTMTDLVSAYLNFDKQNRPNETDTTQRRGLMLINIKNSVLE